MTKLSADYNLAKLYPEVAEEWHPTKNGDLQPKDCYPKGSQKVWWECKQCGHEWPAFIYSRANGFGCPVCGREQATGSYKKTILLKRGSLVDRFPDLASEWNYNKNHPLTPHQFTAFSTEKVWWICIYQHEWQAMIHNRAQGKGCPKCRAKYSKKQIQIYCELKTIFPDILFEKEPERIDMYIENYKIAIEYDGYFRHKGREKEDLIKSQKLLGIGIKTQRIRECSGGRKLKRVLPNDIFCKDSENPLSIVKKLISKLYELFPFDVKTKEKISDYLNSTQLRNESEYKEIIARYPRPLLHDSIEVTHPNISQEWHPDKNGDLIPNMFSKGSSHKAWWVCWVCWHEWKTSVSHRTDRKATGCPECSQIKRYITRTKNLIKKNGSLKKNNPSLAQEWHPTLNIPLTPNDVTSGSDRKVWWKCNQCGNAWEAFIYSRNQGRGCSKCK